MVILSILSILTSASQEYLVSYHNITCRHTRGVEDHQFWIMFNNTNLCMEIQTSHQQFSVKMVTWLMWWLMNCLDVYQGIPKNLFEAVAFCGQLDLGIIKAPWYRNNFLSSRKDKWIVYVSEYLTSEKSLLYLGWLTTDHNAYASHCPKFG